jgi:hypothetical protein
VRLGVAAKKVGEASLSQRCDPGLIFRAGTNQSLELPFPERPVRPNSFDDGSDTAAVTSRALGGQYEE